ncbi:MAG: SPFH domain-containing protein [Solobacterium sp.]|nr:SPFH domain-containing protein [Solobacterium sp.]
MALFQKNDGGIMDVIRCDETDYLIWKWHPQGSSAGISQRANSIRWGSSLRVRDGSVAVFVYPQADGTMEDFIEGPYDEIIKTENFPVLASLIGKLYNGASPFQAEVYFINLANLIQIKFGVPYFDVFDPRFLDFGVPTAVRGSINFRIADYREFIKLHRLDNFDMAQFQSQVKDAIIRHVKSIVSNAPSKSGIPVVQMERQISEINALVETEIGTALREDFGVSITRVDISDIELDKNSAGYKKLQALTQNKAAVFANAAANIVDTMGTHRIGAKRISQTVKEEGKPVEKAIDIGAMGKKVSSAFSGALSGLKNKKATPPPLPISQYSVAVDGKQTGPFDMSALIQMFRDGALTKESLVWKEGMKNWEKAGSVKELSSIFEEDLSQPPAIPE